MPQSYFILDYINPVHKNALREDCTPYDLLSYMKSIEPEKIEPKDFMYRRAQSTKKLWEAQEGSIALVSHSNFFKFFTMTENGSWWLRNGEIREYEEGNHKK